MTDPGALHARSLTQLGEFGLIARIIERLGEAAARDIVVPPGDDAAAWRTGPGLVVATTDAATEGRHWRRDTMSLDDAGWRAIAACVSDLAAMGAVPDAVLVAVLAGPGITLDDLDALTDGMAAACHAHGVRIAGGDIVRAAATALAVTAIGHIAHEPSATPALLRRSAARPGDAIAVSGVLGASAAGLALIEEGRAATPEAAPLVAAHRRPLARLALGQAALAAGVRCAIDISDGLVQDLAHVTAASGHGAGDAGGVGVTLLAEALPLHPAAVALLGEERARNLALGGGEDYELALIGPAEVLRSLSTASLPLTVVGEVTAGAAGGVRLIDGLGHAYMAPAAGWDSLQ